MDIVTVKQRQQAAWASGDYAAVGARFPIIAELLCEAVDLRAGEYVLDVACGNGNATLAAARRFCHVVGVDYVPELLDRARRRAQAEGLQASFQQADAEALPFPDDAFDVVLSTCGAMFAPDQERTAAELLRVCRPGGGSAWSTGPPTATSVSCSGPSVATCRRRRGCGRRCCGAPRSGCGSCSGPR
jgi:ubiquinone/menaquinone biosynthesis C-methylase UbiE